MFPEVCSVFSFKQILLEERIKTLLKVILRFPIEKKEIVRALASQQVKSKCKINKTPASNSTTSKLIHPIAATQRQTWNYNWIKIRLTGVTIKACMSRISSSCWPKRKRRRYLQTHRRPTWWLCSGPSLACIISSPGLVNCCRTTPLSAPTVSVLSGCPHSLHRH